jgi:hypothetical protein
MMIQEDKKVEIILTEYKSLRDEILKKMDTCWKILTFETGGTSLVLGFVFAQGAYELLPLVPFLILVSSFLHLSETSAIINAGNYIRDNIEKNLQPLLGNKNEEYKFMWWEKFVKEQADPYKLIHISTACLFMGMFWASIVLSVVLKDKMEILLTPDWSFNLLLIGYSIAFILYLYVWITEIWQKISRKPKSEEKINK